MPASLSGLPKKGSGSVWKPTSDDRQGRLINTNGVYRELSYILGKVLDARSAERSPPRCPTVKEVARPDDNCDHHAGARHRRQHHHFQHRGCGDAAATPLRSASAVGRSSEDQSRHSRAKWGILPGVLRLATAEPYS